MCDADLGRWVFFLESHLMVTYGRFISSCAALNWNAGFQQPPTKHSLEMQFPVWAIFRYLPDQVCKKIEPAGICFFLSEREAWRIPMHFESKPEIYSDAQLPPCASGERERWRLAWPADGHKLLIKQPVGMRLVELFMSSIRTVRVQISSGRVDAVTSSQCSLPGYIQCNPPPPPRQPTPKSDRLIKRPSTSRTSSIISKSPPPRTTGEIPWPIDQTTGCPPVSQIYRNKSPENSKRIALPAALTIKFGCFFKSFSPLRSTWLSILRNCPPEIRDSSGRIAQRPT